jgi:hypothetical protein
MFPFTYLVDVTIAAANGSAQSTLIMQADSYFELVSIFGSSSQAAELTNISPNYFSVSIRDQTTGNDLMSNQVPQRILCGNAFNGFLERRPVVFEPQSNLFFDFRDLSGNVGNRVQLALHGYKLKI